MESKMAETPKLGRAAGMTKDQSRELRGATTLGTAASALDQDIQVRIGRQLRALYDEVVDEPIPDRFLKLLQDLERRRASGS
jgi:hypothetical protein